MTEEPLSNLDHRRAVERILEDASLTADLVDPAAYLLLEWGTEQVEAILQEMAEAGLGEIGERLAALHRTMRQVSRVVGRVPPEDQAQQVACMLEIITGGNYDDTAP